MTTMHIITENLNNVLEAKKALSAKNIEKIVATISRVENGYIAVFNVVMPNKGIEEVTLSTARKPYEPRIFKSIDGAVSTLQNYGFTGFELKL